VADVTSSEILVRQYYTHFNERRLAEAAALFAEDAILQQALRPQPLRGGAGYLEFANMWLTGFPDAIFTVQEIVSREALMLEASVAATGTHCGALDLGGWIFKPTGARATLYMR
jgi:hypothetical protein